MAFTDYDKVVFWTEKVDPNIVKYIVRHDKDTLFVLEGITIFRMDYLNSRVKLDLKRGDRTSTVSKDNNPIQHVFNLENTRKIYEYWADHLRNILTPLIPSEEEDDDESE